MSINQVQQWRSISELKLLGDRNRRRRWIGFFVMFCNHSSLRVIYRENSLKSEVKKSRKDVLQNVREVNLEKKIIIYYNDDRQSWVFFTILLDSALRSPYLIGLEKRTIPNGGIGKCKRIGWSKTWMGRKKRKMSSVFRFMSLKNKDSTGMNTPLIKLAPNHLIICPRS